MKLSISNKYAVAFGATSLVVGGVIALSFIMLLMAGVDFLRQQVEMTEHEIYEESQGKMQHNIADYLSTYLFVPLYQLDVDSLNRVIKEMKQALPIESLCITDDNGSVITDGTKQNNLYGRKLKLDRPRLKTGHIAEEKTAGGRRITFAIKVGNITAGYGEIVFSVLPMENAIQRHRQDIASVWESFKNTFIRITLFSFSIVLLFAAILSFFFSRTLSRPLIALKEATDKVAAGDLSYRVPVQSDDEIGQLAASFNRMVSDLKTSTERLQHANTKLQNLDRLKSEFISVVSHEFRTPITSIKAFAELILMKPTLPAAKKAKFLEIISSESERLARLISDILDITKIEAGKLYWRMTDVSIEKVIRQAVAGIRPLADQKDIVIRIKIEAALPLVNADQDRLAQVVTNILSNAVKFTPEGGSISVRAFMGDEQPPAIRVAVADTGIGIPEDSLQMIFEKFHRAGDDLTNPVEGTGLGLAIARHIVEHHGGMIYATSKPGTGTTFTFTLPIARTHADRSPMSI